MTGEHALGAIVDVFLLLGGLLLLGGVCKKNMAKM